MTSHTNRIFADVTGYDEVRHPGVSHKFKYRDPDTQVEYYGQQKQRSWPRNTSDCRDSQKLRDEKDSPLEPLEKA